MSSKQTGFADSEELFKSTFEYNTEYGTDFGLDSGGGRPANQMYTKEQLAQMEEESKPKENPLEEIPTFLEFTQATTFHGVAYIFAGAFQFRKIMWLICVVAAIGIFIMQVGQRTFDYFQYNTIVDVQLVYTDTVPFPAVTLCNQNNFRTSISVDHDLYYFVDEMYSGINVSTVDLSKYNIDHIDTLTFLQTAAHQLTDFVDSCTYKGESCNLTRDFVTTLTDLGVCYTFNSGEVVDPLEAHESGINFGLSLILNVEQYEYMRGPQNDAGIKIHLHDQGEFPLMKDLGFAVAPGSHTLVGVERTVITSMEPPYGECNASNPIPMANCQINCRTRMIVGDCGCRDIYMENLSDSPSNLCDMERQFVCIRQQTVEIMKRQSECSCKVTCERVEYTPSLSYAQLSKFNIDRMVLNDPVRRAAVNAKFLRARELSQRVILDVAEEDRVKLTDVKNKLKVLWDDMQVVGPALESDATFAAHYDIMPVIDSGDDMWRSEIVTVLVRFGTIANMYAPVLQTEMMYIDKWLPAAVFNLLEISLTPGETPGIATKLGTCLAMGQITFPLPEYNGEIRTYFRDNSKRRKKRNHVDEHPGLVNFYAVDAPEYEKLKDLDDCNDYLSLKQDMAEALIEHRVNLEADLEHIQTIHTTFSTFFAYLYQNTSKLPTDMPKYSLCKAVLEEWEASLKIRLDTVVASMQLFVDLDNTGDVMTVLTQLLTHASALAEDAAYTIRGKLYLNCYWVYFELLSEDDRGDDYIKISNYNTDLNNGYLSYPNIRTSFYNLKDYGVGIYDILENTIVPALSIIDAYLAERVTKMDMAQVFDSLTLRRALLDLVALSEDFISISREFDQRMKSVLFSIASGYLWVMDTTLPIVDRDVLWGWATVVTAWKTGFPQYRNILERFLNESESWGLVYNDFVMQISDDYTGAVEGLKVRLPYEIDELIKSVDIVTEDLVEYIENNDMNQAFFMENFVQVDVFYKGMVYETIAVQQAFPFLSLLGEVGGFMGLLLGASTLTICEVVDFLFLAVYKRIKRRTTVNPGKDDTMIQQY